LQESSLDPRPRFEPDGIVLRPLATNAEYDEAVALQDETWGAGFTDRVPASILRVGQKVGGVTAAAFDPQGRMLGFVFGLTGVRDGRLVHWSDMLAVREDARGKHLGEKLKQYQRDLVRGLGVETMFWTFDPLVARNAHFNLNRLGARIAEYVPNFYGSNTGSILHGALPTDRFVAEWAIESAGGGRPDATAQRRERPAPDAARTAVVENGRVRVVEPLPDAARVLVPIPHDIEAALGASQEAALAWRLATRAAIMHYFALGYQVTAFHRATERELPAYELTRSPSASQ
jgi:predicted GNAT superfamily acetyltransferase